nr:nuclear pore protein-like protein [Colletotrichum truncatum]KAF6787492.1 nuclear pore protein-like protein [Colletotrichum truncatum]
MDGNLQENSDGGDADRIQPAHSITAVTSPDGETQVDPDGDLILRAGSQTAGPERSFRVCASALRRSSPVWKKMLFGPFKESKPAFGVWQVSLPEDDAGALGILLHIVHANFLLVSHKPSLAELYEVFRLANKYDMILALKPWAVNWLEVAEGFSGTMDGREMASLAYVAWELGQVELQRKMMKELVLSCSVDEEGRMTTADGVVLDEFDPIGPPGLLGFMRRHQQEMLKTLPLHLNSVIRELTDGPGCCVSKTNNLEEKSNCNDIILGSLMRGMANERGSITLTLAGKDGESAGELSASIRKIAEKASTYEGHVKCNPAGKIVSMLGKTIKARTIKLNKASIEKMNKRREDLGLEKSTPPKASD